MGLAPTGRGDSFQQALDYLWGVDSRLAGELAGLIDGLENLLERRMLFTAFLVQHPEAIGMLEPLMGRAVAESLRIEVTSLTIMRDEIAEGRVGRFRPEVEGGGDAMGVLWRAAGIEEDGR